MKETVILAGCRFRCAPIIDIDDIVIDVVADEFDTSLGNLPAHVGIFIVEDHFVTRATGARPRG